LPASAGTPECGLSCRSQPANRTVVGTDERGGVEEWGVIAQQTRHGPKQCGRETSGQSFRRGRRPAPNREQGSETRAEQRIEGRRHRADRWAMCADIFSGRGRILVCRRSRSDVPATQAVYRELVCELAIPIDLPGALPPGYDGQLAFGQIGETMRKDNTTRRKMLHWLAIGSGGLLVAYLVIAYSVLPLVWDEYAHWHPELKNQPSLTHTANGLPGDPLNVGLIGSETDLKRAMLAAKWYPADPLTLRSCLGIAVGTIMHRPYDEAPVSNLYLFGRHEDLAFEQPVGSDPRQRHHVRFWLVPQSASAAGPAWIGATTYDQFVGFSHRTGEITHHIGAEVDRERDKLMEDLRGTGLVQRSYFLDGFQEQRAGKNGGGDRWFTDGRLAVAILRR